MGAGDAPPVARRPGRPRVLDPEIEWKYIFARVSREEYAAIKAFCQQHRQSMASLLREAIWDRLEEEKSDA